MQKIILEKIKTFFKNNYLYIVIGIIFFWMFLKKSFKKNEKAQETIDKSKEQIHTSLEEIQGNNTAVIKAEIEYEIKNNVIEKEHDEIRQQVDEIVNNVNLSKFEKNRKLNELHNQIKRRK